MTIDSTNWSRENLAWAAGFMEGEGYFGAGHKGLPTHIQLKAVNTDLDSLEKLKRILGSGTIYGPKQRKTWKPIYTFSVTASPASYAIVSALYEFMSIRRKSRIKEMIRIYTKQRRSKFYEEMISKL